MGFKEKWAAANGMTPVDHAAEIGRQLVPGDDLIAHAQAIPSAYEGSGGGGLSLTGRLTALAVNAVANAASKQRHVGGEPGTVAYSLPRDADLRVLAFTRSGLSLWDFGPYGSTAPGELVLSLPREQIAGVADTGQRAQGRVPVARVTFADGSYYDYRLTSRPGPEFWTALRGW